MKEAADSQDLLSEKVSGRTNGNEWDCRGDAWRPEPEGETDTLKTKLVSNGVEGVLVDPDGRGKRHEKKVKKFGQ